MAFLRQSLLPALPQRRFDGRLSIIVWLDFKTRYQRIIENLCQLPNQGDMQWLFDSHRKLAEILLIKCDIGPRLTICLSEREQSNYAGDM